MKPGTSRLRRALLPTVGWAMIGLGSLAAGYGVWAWVESNAYLAEVAASGQPVEAFDAANFVMSGAGLFLLVGLLLAAHGGIYLLAARALSRAASRQQAVPAAPQPAAPPPARSAAPSQEDDLDDLLDGIEV